MIKLIFVTPKITSEVWCFQLRLWYDVLSLHKFGLVFFFLIVEETKILLQKFELSYSLRNLYSVLVVDFLEVAYKRELLYGVGPLDCFGWRGKTQSSKKNR